ncbi:multidrug efflux RND transporter permease subunit [bacterium]|nr:multidrug efflux RND transporter permease subunit [bacterium]
MFSNFFINRPIFAMVISIVMTIAGAISIFRLPVVQYPPITPPTVRVTASYPGANARTVEESVAAPIEQQVNGIKGMIYMSSKSSNDGNYTLDVYFQVGYDLDIAAVDVQNRVGLANSQLPSEVVRQGINIIKQSPDILMAIDLISPTNEYDDLYLSNYALINLKDNIARVNGVGQVNMMGKGDYGMRIWVNPDQLAKLGLTVNDVANSIKEQNLQAPAGQVGQPPVPKGQQFQYAVQVKGRLTTKDEFLNIVLRANPDGSVVKIKDVGSVELGAKNYDIIARLNGKPSAIMLVYQLPGANAIQVANQIKAFLAGAKANFPKGMDYVIAYDSTNFVKESIREVLKTFKEAIILVLLVVFLFLQNWRTTLIPSLAVPVSLVGTFAFFALFGLSINTLTLFALVLAIGLVVDDAIVVVEAVESYIEKGHDPKEATRLAMGDVGMPIVAIFLALLAVFVPVVFMTGITGRLYQQFAMTLIVAFGLSAINSLTLTPALSALMLKPHAHGKRRGPLAMFFGGFNWTLDRTTTGYLRIVRGIIRKTVVAFIILIVASLGCWHFLKTIPKGFIPDEDQGLIMSNIQLPEGAAQGRSDEVVRRLEDKIQKIEGVEYVNSMIGYSLSSGINASNLSSFMITLKPWEDRKTKETSLPGIMAKIQQIYKEEQAAQVFPFLLPAIPGISSVGGLQLELQDRSGKTIEELDSVTRQFVASARDNKMIGTIFTGFNTNNPQVFMNLDREKAKLQGVPINNVFDALQMYMGGLYVNDFNLYGRTYRVMLQADPAFRRTPEDLTRFYVRNDSGQMVPLSSLASTAPMSGPQYLVRYNLYRAAEINAMPAATASSGQAMAALVDTAKKDVPQGFGYEWTGMAYQQQQAGNPAAIMIMAVVFVFLVLAAQYESWSAPLSVILAIPIGVLGALTLQWSRGLQNDIYFQIGMVMLIGLAAKNAILIVEFAREKFMHGDTLEEAALSGARARFRPILMTSFAFILGCTPLMLSSGAGANSRQSMGTAVVGGMLAATIVAICVIPTLYVFSQYRKQRRRDAEKPAPADEAHSTEGAVR